MEKRVQECIAEGARAGMDRIIGNPVYYVVGDGGGQGMLKIEATYRSQLEAEKDAEASREQFGGVWSVAIDHNATRAAAPKLLDALKNWFECADEHPIPCRCGRDGAIAAIKTAEEGE